MSDLKVRLQIVRAGLVLGELRVRDSNLASSPPGTARVGQLDDVSYASQVAVVEFHAPADAHAPVVRVRDDDHLVDCACRVEALRLAERHELIG